MILSCQLMLDKPVPFFALPGLAAVTLNGADAARFAQAQFMNDVAALPAGHWQWNGWLTPKGRVIALFALIKRAEDDLLLVLLDAHPADFCAALARFVFRSKVKVTPCPALLPAGRFAAPECARGHVAAEVDGGLELDFGGEDGMRTVLLSSVEPSPASADPLPQPLSHKWERGVDVTPLPLAGEGLGRGAVDLWRQFDLAHGLPRLAPSQAEHWTPQQLSLNRLNAYSVGARNHRAHAFSGAGQTRAGASCQRDADCARGQRSGR